MAHRNSKLLGRRENNSARKHQYLSNLARMCNNGEIYSYQGSGEVAILKWLAREING